MLECLPKDVLHFVLSPMLNIVERARLRLCCRICSTIPVALTYIEYKITRLFVAARKHEGQQRVMLLRKILQVDNPAFFGLYLVPRQMTMHYLVLEKKSLFIGEFLIRFYNRLSSSE
jgi:hypothetical protein